MRSRIFVLIICLFILNVSHSFADSCNLYYKNNELLGEWKGECINGRAEGFGYSIIDINTMYEGNTKNGYASGYGKLEFISNKIIEGYFDKWDLIKGKITYQDGSERYINNEVEEVENNMEYRNDSKKSTSIMDEIIKFLAGILFLGLFILIMFSKSEVECPNCTGIGFICHEGDTEYSWKGETCYLCSGAGKIKK